MEPTEDQRRELGRRIRTERLARYSTKKAAYVAAGVNSSTWDKAEDGDSLAERSRVAILKQLWPDSGGDWERLDPPLGAVDMEQLILEGPWASETKEYMLRLVREDRERAAPGATSGTA